MQVRKKYVYTVHDLPNFVTVGVYFPNGVLCEKDTEEGIGNFVDSTLFERLSLAPFSSDTVITGNTYPCYSVFLLRSPREVWVAEFERFLDAILQPIDADLLKMARCSFRQNFEEQNQDIDDLYEEYYYHNSRFAKPISGDLETVMSLTTADLQQYQQKYYALEQATLCVTGAVSEADAVHFCDANAPLKSVNLKGRKYGKRDASDLLVVETDWDDSDVLISFDCPKAAGFDLLRLEIFCMTCQNVLSSLLGSSDDSFSLCETPKLHLDYAAPKIVFKFSAKNSHLPDVFEPLFSKFGKAIHRLDQETIRKSVRKVTEDYIALSEDSAAMNRWMGWNSMLGEPYNIQAFPFAEVLYREMTLDRILQCFRRFVRSSNAVVAVTNNPEILSNAEVRVAIDAWRKSLF